MKTTDSKTKLNLKLFSVSVMVFAIIINVVTLFSGPKAAFADDDFASLSLLSKSEYKLSNPYAPWNTSWFDTFSNEQIDITFNQGLAENQAAAIGNLCLVDHEIYHTSVFNPDDEKNQTWRDIKVGYKDGKVLFYANSPLNDQGEKAHNGCIAAVFYMSNGDKLVCNVNFSGTDTEKVTDTNSSVVRVRIFCDDYAIKDSTKIKVAEATIVNAEDKDAIKINNREKYNYLTNDAIKNSTDFIWSFGDQYFRDTDTWHLVFNDAENQSWHNIFLSCINNELYFSARPYVNTVAEYWDYKNDFDGLRAIVYYEDGTSTTLTIDDVSYTTKSFKKTPKDIAYVEFQCWNDHNSNDEKYANKSRAWNINNHYAKNFVTDAKNMYNNAKSNCHSYGDFEYIYTKALPILDTLKTDSAKKDVNQAIVSEYAKAKSFLNNEPLNAYNTNKTLLPAIIDLTKYTYAHDNIARKAAVKYYVKELKYLKDYCNQHGCNIHDPLFDDNCDSILNDTANFDNVFATVKNTAENITKTISFDCYWDFSKIEFDNHKLQNKYEEDIRSFFKIDSDIEFKAYQEKAKNFRNLKTLIDRNDVDTLIRFYSIENNYRKNTQNLVNNFMQKYGINCSLGPNNILEYWG